MKAGSNALVVREVGRAIVVTFNRPERRSPLSVEVVEELSRIVGDIPDSASALIFTGAGEVFASAADLREIAEVSDAAAAREFALRGQKLMTQIAELSIPTIAAINGVCFGGALDLALACGRRVASPDAVFAHPGVALGIITGWGGTQRLPRLIGEAVALEMFFTARRLGAAEALKIGLVDELADDVLQRSLAG